jgi:hypothetical protein
VSIAENVSDFADGFDEVKSETLGEVAKLVLLRVKGKDTPFEVVGTIATGWMAKFNEFFSASVFRIADITAATAALVRRASHVMIIDSEIPALNNVVFAGDGKAQPPLQNPYWSYVATSEKRTYFPAGGQEV